MPEVAVAEPSARRNRTRIANASIALLALDDHGRVREASPAACSLLGLEREDVLGHELAELLPAGHARALPGAGDAAATEANGGGSTRRPTDRELQILSLLAAGNTDAEIAERLELSPATVQTHVRNTKQKLGAKTRAQAVAIALRGGLISAVSHRGPR